MCCNASKQQYLEKNGIVWRWRIFAALSQEAPLDLMRLLLAEGAAGLPKDEIATRPSVPSSTLSLHLAALERAGLPPSSRQGRQLVHSLRIVGAAIDQLPDRNVQRLAHCLIWRQYRVAACGPGPAPPAQIPEPRTAKHSQINGTALSDIRGINGGIPD